MPDIGINFRASSGYVTDGTDETYCLAEAYPVTRGGFTFGFSVGIGWIDSRDRDSGLDRRLAGIIFTPNSGTNQATFRIDISPGEYLIRLSLGDAGSAQGYQYCQLKDDTSVIATIADTNGTNAAEFTDATGTTYSAANWPGSNTPINHTFTSSILNVVIGSPDAQLQSTTITHLFLSPVIATEPRFLNPLQSNLSWR